MAEREAPSEKTHSERIRPHERDDEARRYFEQIRWPDGPVCPHCDDPRSMKLREQPRSSHPVRRGVYKCKSCRKQYTVTVGTPFEGTHIPLNEWLDMIRLMCESPEGVNARQLHIRFGISYKTACSALRRLASAVLQAQTVEMQVQSW
jgi:transposase-like protein